MVPAKFIDAIFKEHSHFYGAFFAIEQAYRTHSNASPQPFQKLKSRRVSAMKSEQIMASFEGEGHSFEGLREEMRAAESRWQKAEGESCSELQALPLSPSRTHHFEYSCLLLIFGHFMFAAPRIVTLIRASKPIHAIESVEWSLTKVFDFLWRGILANMKSQ